MAKLKIKTQWGEHKPTLLPQNLDSDTVPNMAMSLRSIMTKHGVGGTFAAGKRPIYEGALPLPPIDRMDISDIKILKEQIEERIALQRQQELDEAEKKENERREKLALEQAEKRYQEMLAKKRFKDQTDIPFEEK